MFVLKISVYLSKLDNRVKMVLVSEVTNNAMVTLAELQRFSRSFRRSTINA